MHTRIAPTPSGYLHLGNACSFLFTRELATRHGGTVRLRIDDIDSDRVRPEYLADIFETLRLLEIDYEFGPVDVPDFQQNFTQHLRLPLYEMLLDEVLATRLVYACFCTRKQLMENVGQCNCRKRSIPLNTENAAWRMHVPDNTIVAFNDNKLGKQFINLEKAMPGFVVRRKDGLPAYQIVSLADDLHFGITCIVRGYDLIHSTAAQIYIAGLIGEDYFLNTTFYHHPLLKGAGEEKLSKSAGDAAVSELLRCGLHRKELQMIVNNWF